MFSEEGFKLLQINTCKFYREHMVKKSNKTVAEIYKKCGSKIYTNNAVDIVIIISLMMKIFDLIVIFCNFSIKTHNYLIRTPVLDTPSFRLAICTFYVGEDLQLTSNQHPKKYLSKVVIGGTILNKMLLSVWYENS